MLSPPLKCTTKMCSSFIWLLRFSLAPLTVRELVNQNLVFYLISICSFVRYLPAALPSFYSLPFLLVWKSFSLSSFPSNLSSTFPSNYPSSPSFHLSFCLYILPSIIVLLPIRLLIWNIYQILPVHQELFWVRGVHWQIRQRMSLPSRVRFKCKKTVKVL